MGTGSILSDGGILRVWIVSSHQRISMVSLRGEIRSNQMDYHNDRADSKLYVQDDDLGDPASIEQVEEAAAEYLGAEVEILNVYRADQPGEWCVPYGKARS